MSKSPGARLMAVCVVLLALPVLLDGSTRVSFALNDAFLEVGQKQKRIDRKTFFAKVRARFHRKGITATQLATYNAILDYWDERPAMVDERWLAYILGTALYESGNRMAPVREALGKTDDQTIARLDRAGGIYAKLRRKGRTFWRRQPQHGNRAYFGRGLIQITHAANYKRMGHEIGIGDALYLNPSLALDPNISVKVLYVGMVKGLYRRDRRGPHSLPRYFHPRNKGNKRVWIRARNIVNGGLFHADKIAAKSRKFLQCIVSVPVTAQTSEELAKARQPQTVPEQRAPADDPQALAALREQELAVKQDQIAQQDVTIENLRQRLAAKERALSKTREHLEQLRGEARQAKAVAEAAVKERETLRDRARTAAKLAAAAQSERERVVREAAAREAQLLAKAQEELQDAERRELRRLTAERLKREQAEQALDRRGKELARRGEELARRGEELEQRADALAARERQLAHRPQMTEQMVRNAIALGFQPLRRELRGLNTTLRDVSGELRNMRMDQDVNQGEGE